MTEHLCRLNTGLLWNSEMIVYLPKIQTKIIVIYLLNKVHIAALRASLVDQTEVNCGLDVARGPKVAKPWFWQLNKKKCLMQNVLTHWICMKKTWEWRVLGTKKKRKSVSYMIVYSWKHAANAQKFQKFFFVCLFTVFTSIDKSLDLLFEAKNIVTGS